MVGIMLKMDVAVVKFIGHLHQPDINPHGERVGQMSESHRSSAFSCL
jgi:hypothetical protein